MYSATAREGPMVSQVHWSQQEKKQITAHSLSPLLPWAPVGHSWRAESINAHCFPFKFLLGGESSWTLGRERKRSIGASSPQTFLCQYYSLWYLDLPHFLLLFFLAGFLPSKPWAKSVYQSCNRTPGGETQPTIWVFQLHHLSDFSLNKPSGEHIPSFPGEETLCSEHPFSTGHRQE